MTMRVENLSYFVHQDNLFSKKRERIMSRNLITSALAVLAVAAFTFTTPNEASAGSVVLVGTGAGSLQHNGTTKIDILDPNDDNTVDTTEWGNAPTIANWPTAQTNINTGYNTGGQGWQGVFDNNTVQKVCCDFTPGQSSVTMTSSTTLYSLTGYTLTTGNDVATRRPDGWRLFGSTDNFGASNVLLDTVVQADINGGAGWTADQQVGEVTLAGPTTGYSSFRIIFDDSVSPNVFQLAEIELFGTEFISSTAPEPSTFILAALGLMLLGFRRRRSTRK